MAESSKPKSGGGCLGKLMFLFFLTMGGGLGAALFFIAQPQDMSDIGGYSPTARATPVRDMKAVLKNSLDRGYPVTLTETEINQWLGRTLVAKQAGLLANQVTLDRVWVRLEEGQAEVIMERRIMGRPVTVSMFVQLEQFQGAKGLRTEVLMHGGPYHTSLPHPMRGGRFGKLVVPQGFLLLVMPSYRKLAAAFPQEIHLAFEEMARIKIGDNRLELNPREPSGGAGAMPRTF